MIKKDILKKSGVIDLVISKVIKNKMCIEIENSNKIYTIIKLFFVKGHSIILDFTDIDLILPIFFRNILEKLYKDFSHDFVDNKLFLRNISKVDENLFHRAKDLVKLSHSLEKEEKINLSLLYENIIEGKN